jgi:hypothetical protein
MARAIVAALASTTAIGACGRQPPTNAPPAATAHASVRDWDRSSVQSDGGKRFAFVGPVLRSVDPLGTNQRVSVVSHRCLSIAQGIPYLRLPDEVRLSPNEIEAFFVGGWLPREAARRDVCRETFGSGWHLPTLAQARAALTPHDAPWGWLSVLVRDEKGRIDTLQRETERCSALEQLCKPNVRITQGAAKEAAVYCVGPASELPPPEPSDAEIARCVHAVTRAVRQTGEQMPRGGVDETALDFIFEVRHACTSNNESDYAAIAGRVRTELGSVTLSDRSQELKKTLGRLQGHAARVQEALAAVAQGALPSDCKNFPKVYRAKCSGAAGHGDCLGWQAGYVAHCMNQDVALTLTPLANDVAASVAELQSKVRRMGTLEKAMDLALKCSQTLDSAVQIRRVLGHPTRAVDSPRYCNCSPEDLPCGLAASLDPSGCPDQPATNRRTPHHCGCAAGDLACQMRCKN